MSSIIDDIVKKVECEYLSDLRFHRDKWNQKLENAVNDINEENYDLSEWREFISYILDIDIKNFETLKDVHEAKEYIIKRLNTKKD